MTSILSNLEAFVGKYPTTNLVITNGRDDVFEGRYDRAGVSKALNPRENVIALYCREAFFSLHVVKGALVDCWRSPNGAWIGDELGLEGRNVFGNLPEPARLPKEERVPSVPRVAAPVVAPTANQLAEAARTGNLAAAINGA